MTNYSFCVLLVEKYGNSCRAVKRIRHFISYSFTATSIKHDLLNYLDKMVRNIELEVLGLEFNDISVGLLIQLDGIFEDCFVIAAQSDSIKACTDIFSLLNVECLSELVWSSMKYLINRWICTNEILIDEYFEIFTSKLELNKQFIDYFSNSSKFFSIGHLRRLFCLEIKIGPIESFSAYYKTIEDAYQDISCKTYDLMKERIENLCSKIRKYAFFCSNFQIQFDFNFSRMRKDNFSYALLLKSILDYLDVELGDTDDILISVRNDELWNIPCKFYYFNF